MLRVKESTIKLSLISIATSHVRHFVKLSIRVLMHPEFFCKFVFPVFPLDYLPRNIVFYVDVSFCRNFHRAYRTYSLRFQWISSYLDGHSVADKTVFDGGL